MSVFTESKLNEVFYRVAKFPNDSKHAFIHAPFDVLSILGSTYIMPRTFAGACGAGGTAKAFWLNNDVIDSQENKADGRDLWYTELNPLVIEEHQLGDYQGHAEDWTGFFALGLI